jgi:phosphoserine phosphatase RsbU/P
MLSVLLKQRMGASVAGEPVQPSTVLANLNRDLLPECTASGLFVTIAFVLIDMRQLTAVIASAGHTPVVHVRSGGEWSSTERTGPALGLVHGATYEDRFLELRRGDRLLLYTDGLLPDQEDGTTAEQRLAEELVRLGPASGGLTRLFDGYAARGGAASDDVTLVLLTMGDARSKSHLDNGVRPAAPADEGGRAVLRAGVAGDTNWLAVHGRGTWTQCAAFHELSTAVLAEGRRLVLDLADCAYLDSTFLGTIHHVVCAAGPGGERVTLVRVPESVRKLFEELDMRQVQDRIQPHASPAPSEMIPLAERPGDRSPDIILHARELLAALSESTERQFGDVVRVLRSEAGAR